MQPECSFPATSGFKAVSLMVPYFNLTNYSSANFQKRQMALFSMKESFSDLKKNKEMTLGILRKNLNTYLHKWQ